MQNEKVSIIMGVYNCSQTIRQAIDSVIKQTYTDWEFIICDDASTDDTYETLLEYKNAYPEKIIILKNKKNSKLAYSLNHCLTYATGTYIARMDGDDISHKKRLEEQVNYLKNNKDIDLVGTSMQRFDEKGKHDVVHNLEKPDKYSLRYGPPFNHATIITYKEVYDKLRGYTVSKRTIRSQDYELWFRFYNNGFVGRNINKPLYFVREDNMAIRRRTIRVRYNSYRISMSGFKMLKYPKLWYIRPTLSFLIKAATPYILIDIYRKYQKCKTRKN